MNEEFMRKAIELSKESVQNGGGPFGAVIVKDGKIIATGTNCVTKSNDPTAHAEINAIREACKKLKTFQLDECEIYTSCEPCPMCLSAIYWAHIQKIYYSNTRIDAARNGFSDAFIYNEIPKIPDHRRIPAVPLLRGDGAEAFHIWHDKTDKTEY
jgi:guanine deaminase